LQELQIGSTGGSEGSASGTDVRCGKNVHLLRPISEYVDALVHPSVRSDVLASARHRAFIAPRLIGGLVALASFPGYLALRGVPSAIEVAIFAWLLAPILCAYFLSVTGRYESAHLLSSLALVALVTVVAANTGGITSFAAIWLVVAPFEAAPSASRRVVTAASTFAVLAAIVLIVCSAAQVPPEGEAAGFAERTLVALGVVSATLYASGLALGTESLARAGLRRLAAEEDRYRLLARNMSDVITRHARNGSVLFASPAAEPLIGVRAELLRGHGLFDRIHVTDRPAYLSALADAAAGEPRTVEFRLRCERPDSAPGAGRFIWIEMRCRPLDRAGAPAEEPGEVIAVMRDVTERKAQEVALEQACAEAERANTAKSHFLATMSHELRTPLNAIIGFSEMLLNEKEMRIGVERRHEYAKLINDSGSHLLSVVNGILDMTKIDTGDFEITPEPFPLPDVIVGCCDLLALKAREAGIELVAAVPADLPELVADKRAVKQILINLLSNAIKFTDRGGRVKVDAAVEGQTVAIGVEDNGIGIGEDDLSRIGRPFFQARASYDRRHDGTGLGLSIVKGLVALHGGEISIRSRVGEGTGITVRLPLDCEKARAAVAPARIVRHVPVDVEPHGAARDHRMAARRDETKTTETKTTVVKKSA
jgi:cell cycle sensor histidine kinase DivJ